MYIRRNLGVGTGVSFHSINRDQSCADFLQQVQSRRPYERWFWRLVLHYSCRSLRLTKAGVIWIFLAVMIGMFTVVLSMAEMASMYVVLTPIFPS
jgi:hypothetical protein